MEGKKVMRRGRGAKEWIDGKSGSLYQGGV
jgi:hypothetical protein